MSATLSLNFPEQLVCLQRRTTAHGKNFNNRKGKIEKISECKVLNMDKKNVTLKEVLQD